MRLDADGCAHEHATRGMFVGGVCGVVKMEKANEVGDVQRVFKMVNHLTKKATPPPSNLTSDEHGNMLTSPNDIAAVWFRFLAAKFAATPREGTRAPLEPLPTERSAADALTRTEFDKSVNRMPNAKVVVPCGVPIEAYKYCPRLSDKLFDIINQMWESETVPANFLMTKFTMLFKNKGSRDDPTKYRYIGLLNHEYKVLSQILLARLLHSADDFLKDWQAGFRARRSCWDNSMILRTLCQRMLSLGEVITVTFIDYSITFDSVSHHFLDNDLKDVGVPTKLRAMFRAVYNKSASAYTTVATADNKKVKSDIFPINRGVVQGDITSPLYFILALELILR